MKVWTDASGANLTELARCKDVVLNEMGDFLIADMDNHRVLLCSVTGALCTVVAGAGGFGSGAMQLRYPTGVAFDHVGNYLVSDGRTTGCSCVLPRRLAQTATLL